MRLALLAALVGLIGLVALVRPRVGLYGYIWYALMRPDVFAYVADVYNFSLVLAVFTMMGSLPYIAKIRRLFQHWILLAFLLLNIPLMASALLAAKPTLATVPYMDFLKSMAVVLLIPVLIEDRKQLRMLLTVIALSVGVIGLKFGGFGLLLGGVTIIDGHGGQMSDNNLVGLGLSMVVPLCWYVRDLWSSFIIKSIFLGIAVVTVAAIVMTNSRGSALALAAVLLSILARSKRKLMTGALLAVIAAGPVYLIYDQYVARMQTMMDPNQEESAASRLVQYQVALRMSQDYLFLGVGYGGMNFVALSSKYGGWDSIHVVHNSYLQMLVDSGLPAFLIYIALLWGSILWIGWKCRSLRNDTTIVACGYGLQVGLLAFSIGGTFYSSQQLDFQYILMICAATWGLIVRAESQADVQTGEAVGKWPISNLLETA